MWNDFEGFLPLKGRWLRYFLWAVVITLGTVDAVLLALPLLARYRT
jgi:hypothetical protein